MSRRLFRKQTNVASLKDAAMCTCGSDWTDGHISRGVDSYGITYYLPLRQPTTLSITFGPHIFICFYQEKDRALFLPPPSFKDSFVLI